MPFTADELDWTKAVVGFVSVGMPAIERNQPLPPQIAQDMRSLLVDLGGDAMVIGAMKACDVAIKRLTLSSDRSLTEAGEQIGEILDRIRGEDRFGFGPAAYDDGKRCAVIMTEAMVGDGRGDFSSVFNVNDPNVTLNAFRAWVALLAAMILTLSVFHSMSVSEASRTLALEVATIEAN